MATWDRQCRLKLLTEGQDRTKEYQAAFERLHILNNDAKEEQEKIENKEEIERLGIKQRILQFVQSPVYIIYIIIPFILFVTLIDDIIVIAFDRDSTRELIILIIKDRRSFSWIFFTLDFVALVSLVMEVIIAFMSLGGGATGSFANFAFARTGRTARAAARLARLSSAGKLFRQRGNQLSKESTLEAEQFGMDIVDKLENDDVAQQTEAKILSDKLNNLISARFLAFVILIILVVGVIGSQALTDNSSESGELDQLENIYIKYGPNSADFGVAYGDLVDNHDVIRLEINDTFIIDDGNKFDSLQIERMKFAESASGFVAVVYDITAEARSVAWVSLVTVVFMILLIAFGTMSLVVGTSKLVLTPLEKLLGLVDEIKDRAAFGEDDDAAVYGLSSADESKEVIKAFQKMRESAQAKNYRAEAVARLLKSDGDTVNTVAGTVLPVRFLKTSNDNEESMIAPMSPKPRLNMFKEQANEIEMTEMCVAKPLMLRRELKVEAAASVLGMIEWLTYHEYPNPEYAHVFLFTYHLFVPPPELLRLLIKRACIHPPKMMMMGSSTMVMSNHNMGGSFSGGKARRESGMLNRTGDSHPKGRMTQILEFEKTRQIPIRLRVCGILRLMMLHHFEDFFLNNTEKEQYVDKLKEEKRLRKTRAADKHVEQDGDDDDGDCDSEASTDDELNRAEPELNDNVVNPVMADLVEEFCHDILPGLGMSGQGVDLWMIFCKCVETSTAFCLAYSKWKKQQNMMEMLASASSHEKPQKHSAEAKSSQMNDDMSLMNMPLPNGVSVELAGMLPNGDIVLKREVYSMTKTSPIKIDDNPKTVEPIVKPKDETVSNSESDGDAPPVPNDEDEDGTDHDSSPEPPLPEVEVDVDDDIPLTQPDPKTVQVDEIQIDDMDVLEVPFITIDMLTVDIDTFVQQLCIYDERLVKSINPSELTCLGWMKEKKYTQSQNIMNYITFFNSVSSFIVASLVSCRDIKARTSLLERWISIGSLCKSLNNFSSAMVVVTALSSSPVSRLKRTWAALPAKLNKRFQSLCDVLSPMLSYKQYRAAVRKARRPVVPCVSVILSDMVFSVEGASSFTADGWINFQQCYVISSIIEELLYYSRRICPEDPVDEINSSEEEELEGRNKVTKSKDSDSESDGNGTKARRKSNRRSMYNTSADTYYSSTKRASSSYDNYMTISSDNGRRRADSLSRSDSDSSASPLTSTSKKPKNLASIVKKIRVAASSSSSGVTTEMSSTFSETFAASLPFQRFFSVSLKKLGMSEKEAYSSSLAVEPRGAAGRQ